jgi:hypothetical protein
MRYLYIVELHVCQKCNNNECRTTMLLWQTYFAGNNKTYLGLHVKCQIFNQILSFRSPKNSPLFNFIAFRPVEAAPIRADGRTDMT